jgi:hypothetical protein
MRTLRINHLFNPSGSKPANFCRMGYSPFFSNTFGKISLLFWGPDILIILINPSGFGQNSSFILATVKPATSFFSIYRAGYRNIHKQWLPRRKILPGNGKK